MWNSVGMFCPVLSTVEAMRSTDTDVQKIWICPFLLAVFSIVGVGELLPMCSHCDCPYICCVSSFRQIGSLLLWLFAHLRAFLAWDAGKARKALAHVALWSKQQEKAVRLFIERAGGSAGTPLGR